MKKLLCAAIIMAALFLPSSVTSAETPEYDSFTVSLPTNISLDNSGNGTYEISVNGELTMGHTLTVKPSKHFNLVSNYKIVTATVSQAMNTWQCSDAKNAVRVQGKICCSPKPTVGQWTGSMEFTITLNDVEPEAGWYDATTNVMLYDWDELVNGDYVSGGTTLQKSTNFASLPTGRMVIDDSVTALAYNGFIQSTNLVEVNAPKSVTSINGRTFWNCSNLEKATFFGDITSIPSYTFDSCKKLAEITLPDSIEEIGAYAFSQCNSLLNITLPDGLLSIGPDAFEYCNSLTSVVIPDSVTALGSRIFCSCGSLTSVKVSENVTTIPSYAFAESKVLENVELPSSLKTIYEFAFCNCESLKSIELPDGLEKLGRDAFYRAGLESIVIPDSVHCDNVDGYLFLYCTNLKSATIPNDWLKLPEGIFDMCYSLTQLNMPENLEEIGGFSLCNTALVGLTLPSTMKFIGAQAFNSCSKLVSINIPEGVTSIGHKTFNQCLSLQTITLPSTIISVSSEAFNQCTSLTSVTFNEGVTEVGANCFYGCKALTSINIPSTLTNIGESAFSDCENLVGEIVIPEGTEKISKCEFFNCPKITRVVIPDSVTEIGVRAFSQCFELANIDIPSDLTNIRGAAFYETAWVNQRCAGNKPVVMNGVLIDCSDVNIPNLEFSTDPATMIAKVGLTPDNATMMPPDGEYLFYGNQNIKNVTIAPGTETIGEYAFGQSAVEHFTCNDDIQKISEGAFNICKKLQSVVLSNSVISIEDYAFQCCYALTSITWSNSLESIGRHSFEYDDALTNVSLPASLKSIGAYSFCMCTNADIIVPDSLTTINTLAFSKVKHITYHGSASGSPWGAKSIN